MKHILTLATALLLAPQAAPQPSHFKTPRVAAASLRCIVPPREGTYSISSQP